MPDGSIKSREELQDRYTTKGVIEHEEPILAYARSWSEWAKLVDVPIEKDV